MEFIVLDLAYPMRVFLILQKRLFCFSQIPKSNNTILATSRNRIKFIWIVV